MAVDDGFGNIRIPRSRGIAFVSSDMFTDRGGGFSGFGSLGRFLCCGSLGGFEVLEVFVVWGFCFFNKHAGVFVGFGSFGGLGFVVVVIV